METIIKSTAKLAGKTFIGEMVKEVVKEYISPRLKNAYNNKSMEKERDIVEHNITEYLERVYKNNEYINTIVFKNQQKKLEELYVPLTVSKYIDNGYEEKVEICIRRYEECFIPSYNNVLLVDNAGMGKSTIMKYLYLCVIKQNVGIPILIELRKLEKNTSIVDFIVKEIDGINGKCNKDIILELIKGGDFIFFFDGYDEIALENKSNITVNIQEFIDKAYNNRFIISSRDEEELNSFGDFQRFYIKSLDKVEAYELIKKYDNNGELSNELIEKLESEENLKILKEFLENPLMVSLLYKAFEYNKRIPYKKHIFYKQVYDALFEQHDLSKGGAYRHIKKSGLDIDDFHKILRCLAFITLSKGIEYSRENLIEYVNSAKEKNSEVEFKTSDFIWDIVHSVPLFIKDGLEYKWIHKSFQEYFAAAYICNDSKKNLDKLLKIASSESKISKYYNILDFCYDMDYKSFSRSVLNPVIEEFIKYYSNNYTNKYYCNMDKKDIEIRKSMEFSYEKIFIKKINEDNRKLPILKGFDVFNETNFDGEFKFIISGSRLKFESIAVNLGSKRRTLLMKLLYNKGNKIVSKIENIDIVRKKEVDNFMKGIQNYEWNLLNDDIENIFNKKDRFSNINNWLQKYIAIDLEKPAIIFNYNECIKLKNNIDKEIIEEEIDLAFL